MSAIRKAICINCIIVATFGFMLADTAGLMAVPILLLYVAIATRVDRTERKKGFISGFDRLFVYCGPLVLCLVSFLWMFIA